MNKVNILSNKDITKEIENIFQNESFIKCINDSSNIEEKINKHNTLPTILIYYYIITNRKNYDLLISKYNNESVYEYYKKIVVKELIDVNCLELNMTKIINLIEFIYLQCFNNRFYTHSFSGALYKDINDEGLDISKERFQTEYEIINEIIPNKQHKITYNQLSNITFDNTYMSPRRLTNMFDINLNINEPMYNTLERSIINKLMSLNISNCDVYLQQIKRITDFYYKQNKSCIAVFKIDNNVKENASYIRKIFIEKLYTYQEYLKKNIKKYKKEYDKIRYISECTKPIINKYEMLEEYFKDLYLNKIELRYSIDELFSNSLTDVIVNYCMINNADNHKSNEIIPRSKIAIAKINNLFN